MISEFEVSTDRREQFVDVTPLLQQWVLETGVKDGILTVFVPHTSAAITINENTDPTVRRDILTSLSRLIPYKGDYLHAEGNSDAHLKCSLIGSSEKVIIGKGRLLLGTWQSLFFTEFDGPRKRRMIAHVREDR